MVISKKKQRKKTFFFPALLFFILLTCNSILAQSKRAAIWHVGNKRLNFNTTPITISEINAPFLGTSLSNSLSTQQGEMLLFMSAYGKLYNKHYNVITNNGGGKLCDFFIPKPNNDSLIYLMSVDNYRVVDVKNNKFISKENIKWNDIYGNDPNNVAYHLNAIHHSNCNDIWVIVRDSAFNIYSYLLTNKGISERFVKSNIAGFSLKLSPTGKYFCMFNRSNSKYISIIFGKFDRKTGLFTQTVSKLLPNVLSCASCAFSPDESKLYLNVETNKHDELYQVDIVNEIPQIDDIVILNELPRGYIKKHPSMQLGIDGKIYITYYFRLKRIDIIHQPNIKGKGCNYQANAISLSTGGNGLPRFVTTYLSNNPCELSFYSQNFCYGDYTLFNINNADKIKSVLWDFGDDKSSTELSPKHYYDAPGEYTVTLQVTFTNGNVKRETQTINISNFNKLRIKKGN